MKSVMLEGGRVSFPAFNKERHYMIPFMQKEGLPDELSHWQETVDGMLSGIESHEPIYFMADQAYVHAGIPHRRPGVHVDGYWVPEVVAHGGGGHVGYGRHGGHLGVSRHRGYGGHGGHASVGKWSSPPDWSHVDFSQPEAIILASNVEGAMAWLGDYDESLIEVGGKADLVPLECLMPIDMVKNRVYVGNVGTLHASIPLQETSYRTMVRLNCPGVSVT